MGIQSHRKHCYCAFCKSPRVIYTKRRIDMMNVFAVAIASVMTMYAIWQEFDPRVILIFVLYLALAEVFVQIRWRLSIVCKECGFDPSLYLKDQSVAAEKVKNHLTKRKEDPTTLFKPPLDIPKISKERLSAVTQTQDKAKELNSREKKGKLLSKQI